MKVNEIFGLNAGVAVTLVTHNGCFHADDVSATAILEIVLDMYNHPYEVVRVHEPASAGYHDDDDRTIIYDVGGGQYDHHQTINNNDNVRADGGKYSSIGLIWREIGESLVGKYHQTLYDKVIRPIDDHDNGVNVNTLSLMIKDMYILGNIEEFEQAVQVMKTLLKAQIRLFRELLSNERRLQEYLVESDGNLFIMEEYTKGYLEFCCEHAIPFVIYPSNRKFGEWNFQTVPRKKEEPYGAKIIEIPDSVRELEGVTFLHPKRFLGSATSRERAIEICQGLISAASK